MTLSEYIQKNGTKAKKALAKKAGVRWATIHDIARGAATPRPETAKAIEKATDGQVTAVELLGLGAAEAMRSTVTTPRETQEASAAQSAGLCG